MKRIVALTAALLAATPALAVERPYLGVSYLQSTMDVTGTGDFTLGGVQLRGGSMLTDHFGLEAHVALGTADDTVNFVTIDLKRLYGINGVARMNMGRGGLYAYVGYTTATIGVDAVTENRDGVSYGAGLDFPAFWGTSVEVDYKSILDKDNFSITGVSVGLRRYFD